MLHANGAALSWWIRGHFGLTWRPLGLKYTAMNLAAPSTLTILKMEIAQVWKWVVYVTLSSGAERAHGPG